MIAGDYYLKKELYDLVKKDESIFDFIQEASLDGLWYWDLEHPEEEWMSPKFWDVLGYDYRDMPYKSNAWQHLINQDDLKVAAKNLEKHCKDPDYPYDQTVRYRHKDGSTVWIRCRGMAIRDENGKAIRMLGAHQDITKFKREAIKQKLIIEGSNLGTWEWYVQSQEIIFNDRWAELLGYTLAELEPLSYETWSNLVHPDDLKKAEEQLKLCIEKKIGLYDVEIRMKHKNGHWVWVNDRGNVVEWTATGKPILMFGTQQDISERKAKEFELERNAQLLKASQKIAKIGTWELDIATGITTWTDEVYEIHEVKKDFNHNKVNGINFYHPDYRAKISEAINTSIEKKIPFDVKCKFITAKNNQRWVRSAGYPLIEDNKITKLIGVFWDITQEENDKDAIQREQSFSKQLIENMLDGFSVIDAVGKQTLVNKAFTEMVGYTEEELIGRTAPYPYWPPEETKTIHKAFKQVLAGSKESFELNFKNKEGKRFPVIVSANALVNEQGETISYFANIKNITVQKQKEEALRVSEETFRGNFENAPIGMAIISSVGEWVEVNKKVTEILEYPAEELKLLTFQDITHPDDLNNDLSLLNEVIEGKRDHYQMEKRYYTKNNRLVHALLAVSCARDKKGKVIYFISQIIDVSKIKFQELEIGYQKNLLTSLYQLSPIGIALNDFETGKFIDANDKLLEPTGYTKKEFLSLSYWDVTPKKYENLEATALEQMKSTGKYEKFDKEYIRRDGTTYPVSLQGMVVKDVNGKQLIWSFIRDISKEKEDERKLKEALANMQAILNASEQVAIIATNTSGTITLFNSGAEKLLGYKAEELVNQAIPSHFQLKEEIEKESKLLSEKYQKEISGFDTFIYEAEIGKQATKEWTFVNKNGDLIPVLLSVNKIVLDHTKIGYLGVATDISEIKKAEKEIKHLLDITENQNERLKNFAQIVAHNLRSHSSGITGMVDLFKLEFPDLSNNEMLGLLENGVQNLKQTVEDLTEVVKVNLSQDVQKEIQLVDLITKNVESLTSQLSTSKVKLINEVPPTVSVRGIPAYLNSIVLNMITNAIKYKSNERQAYLRIYCEQESSSLSIFFEDNGLGIDLEKHEDKLFGMYKTFHKHEDSRGIGLFITKNQIESMGGKISVTSKVNKGTTFKITLKN